MALVLRDDFPHPEGDDVEVEEFEKDRIGKMTNQQLICKLSSNNNELGFALQMGLTGESFLNEVVGAAPQSIAAIASEWGVGKDLYSKNPYVKELVERVRSGVTVDLQPVFEAIEQRILLKSLIKLESMVSPGKKVSHKVQLEAIKECNKIRPALGIAKRRGPMSAGPGPGDGGGDGVETDGATEFKKGAGQGILT